MGLTEPNRDKQLDQEDHDQQDQDMDGAGGRMRWTLEDYREEQLYHWSQALEYHEWLQEKVDTVVEAHACMRRGLHVSPHLAFEDHLLGLTSC